jgi:outer membrane biosynthesis protein TonB
MIQFLLALALMITPRASAAAGLGGSADSVRAASDVQESAMRNASDVRRCYEREGLSRDPKLRGTVEVSITILPTGVVQKATVKDSLSGDRQPVLADCIVKAVKNWRFERGPYVVETVVFPFNLAPADVVQRSPVAQPLDR